MIGTNVSEISWNEKMKELKFDDKFQLITTRLSKWMCRNVPPSLQWVQLPYREFTTAFVQTESMQSVSVLNLIIGLFISVYLIRFLFSNVTAINRVYLIWKLHTKAIRVPYENVLRFLRWKVPSEQQQQRWHCSYGRCICMISTKHEYYVSALNASLVSRGLHPLFKLSFRQNSFAACILNEIIIGISCQIEHWSR